MFGTFLLQKKLHRLRTLYMVLVTLQSVPRHLNFLCLIELTVVKRALVTYKDATVFLRRRIFFLKLFGEFIWAILACGGILYYLTTLFIGVLTLHRSFCLNHNLSQR